MHLTELRLRRTADFDLAINGELISNYVDRLRHLPVAVAHHPSVIASLSNSQSSVDEERLALDNTSNHYLQTVSEAAGSSLLYVIDTAGQTRAANNWRQTDSLVGNRYLFRPYFQQAIEGNEARYFAVGVTTDEAGYYFAQPVRKQGVIVGVAVVKQELESLQQQWLSKKPHTLLIDEEGVIILSSNPKWRYQTTVQLSKTQLTDFGSQRKYANKVLTTLDKNRDLSHPRLWIDGQQYLSTTMELPLQNWRLVQLTPRSPVYNSGIIAALVSALLVSLGSAIFLYRRERRRKNLLSAAAQDADRMRSLNQALEAQINERRKAERHLKDAQSELIQASKLAALGQMSAAIAHEVNQPLSAIRTYSASAKLLLDRDRLLEAHHNLDEIHALTERLALLTYDLKTFARKSDVPRELITLQDCVRRVIGTLQSDLKERDIALHSDMPNKAVCVLGNSIRMDQVLSNLLRNAMDASTSATDKAEVTISISTADEMAVINVKDNGVGVKETDITHVFEPFFTTKPMGEGVGLGLSIAYGIVEEMGGQLKVRNTSAGGAMFTVSFPFHRQDDE